VAKIFPEFGKQTHSEAEYQLRFKGKRSGRIFTQMEAKCLGS